MRVPPRKSDGRKTVSVPAPLASPCGRGGQQRGRRRANNGNVNRKMLAPSQADDVPRAQGLSVTCGDSSPKGEPRHRILAQEMERICIDTLHSLFYGYPSMRVPPESRMVVKRFPSQPLASPCGRGGQRSEDGEKEQITALTSIGKCWHLRRQMTSRGRKALSVTCGDSSPKGRAKASYIGTRNGAYLYRYAPFTVLRLPLNARAARKSDGRKTVSVPAPCLSLWEVASSEDGEGQITATSIGKCWHLRRQMTSRGRKGPLSHLR